MKQQYNILFLVIIFVIFTSLSVLAWPVPDSGQTKCYNDTEEIPCPSPGEDFYGQDGNYNINSQSYTKLDENGNDLPDNATGHVMVRDNVTGLIWEAKTDDSKYLWSNFHRFIDSINTDNFGGYNDWRFSTIKELCSIVNRGRLDPTINVKYFPNTISVTYFSSTATANYNSVYDFNFGSGFMSSHTISDGYPRPARAVRGGQSRSFDNFIINNDGTVTDFHTGLMWQEGDKGDKVTWKGALSYCESLSLSGYSDWRLPTIDEILSVANYNEYFLDIPFRVWSSTTNIKVASVAESMSFGWVDRGALDKSDGYDYYVRAVRGGQNRLPGHLFILKPKQASKWNIDSSMPITWETNNISGDVEISISYQGGKKGTFETIIENTSNDGIYEWTVPERLSYNCVLKIEHLSNPDNYTTQGLFSIVGKVNIFPLNAIVSEPGSADPNTATFKITLSETPQPDTDVTIELTATNPGECIVTPASVTLDENTWNTGQDVTVTGVADNIVDGDQITAILTSRVISDDSRFGGLNIANVMVTVKDDSAGMMVNSVYPAYGPENKDMDVTIKGYGFNSSTQVYIYQTGNTEISVSETFISDKVLKATLPGQSAGEYNLKVNRSGVIAELEKAIEFYQISAVENKKAIIVAGGGPYLDNDMWTATRKCADMAYHTLYSQGYSKDNIQYLSMQGVDVTGDGETDTDAVATSEKLQTAIETWAADANLTELILYMVGPGGNGKFQFKSDQNPEYLTPVNLNTWLDTLQTTATNAKIIVIYDACQSGSFLPALSGTNRIIIAGSQANERAWFLDDGEISFSWLFWNEIYSQAEVYEAFDNAKNRLSLMQTPILDDNSGSPRKSRRTDPEVVIGRGRKMTLTLPEVQTISFNPLFLNGDTSADITAGNVQDTNGSGMSRVWARILPPFDAFKPFHKPVLVVPTVSLSGPDASHNFTTSYEAFDQAGNYKVFIHAIDRMGLTAFPKYSLFQQLGGQKLQSGDFNADLSVDLKDALIALQVACGFVIPTSADLEVTDDDKIGVPDALWIIRKVAGLMD